MENHKHPQLNRDENLRAENNLLKVKLDLEYGIQAEDTGALSPELENQWLKQVYAFEQQYKDAKRTSLYDYLGRPVFKKWDTVSPSETSEELERIRSLMAKNNVRVDCICAYDDAVIYKFITEELFTYEMDDMLIPGMTCHFTYEEFHPKDDHELRRQIDDFLNTIFERQCHAEFDQFTLAVKVTFSGKDHDRAGISAIITAFQEARDAFESARLHITEMIINTEITMADVGAMLSVSAKRQGEQVVYEGGCSFHFVRENGCWYIDKFQMSGMV